MAAFLLSLNWLVVAQNGPTPGPVELTRLLASPNFAERELAGKALEKLGAQALPALDQAVQAGDLEISRRADLLRRRIRGRVVQGALLQPPAQMWPVRGKNAQAALEEIQKRHDLAVIQGPKSPDLNTIKFDKDLGPAAPWQCWQQLLDQAGLQEPFLVPRGIRAILQRRQEGMTINLDSRLDPEDSQPGVMVIEAMGHHPVATHLAGNLRLRLQAAAIQDRRKLVPWGAYLFLEVRAWPGAPFLGVEKIDIERLTDDLGKELKPTVLDTFPAQAGMVASPDSKINPWSSVQFTPIHTVLASGNTKGFKEVRGRVQLRGGWPEPILTIARFDQEQKKDVRGLWPGKARLLAADIDEGTLTLRLRLESIDDLVRDYPGPRAYRIRPGLVAERGAGEILAEHLHLIHKGKTISWSSIQSKTLPEVAGVELELSCDVPTDRLTDYRLDLVWPRPTQLEAPFHFRDVRLP